MQTKGLELLGNRVPTIAAEGAARRAGTRFATCTKGSS
jgi:hypothetical protein